MKRKCTDEITIKRLKGCFTMVPNAILEDRELSLEARGFLAYLLSRPADWKFIPGHLQKLFRIGRDKYYKIVKELKARGYLVVHETRGADGRFVKREWEIRQKRPAPENPDAIKPESGKTAHLSNTDKDNKTEKKLAAHNELPSCDSTQPNSSNEAEKAFEKFWGTHARPKDRAKSKRLFEEAVRKFGVKPNSIVFAAQQHAAKMRAAETPRQFVNTSVTWLDQRMWEEFEAKKSTGQVKADIAVFWAEEVKKGAYISPTAIKPTVARQMIARELVTEAELTQACGR